MSVTSRDCPRCGNEGAQRFGTRPHQRLLLEEGKLVRRTADVQRHRCGSCGHVFSGGPGAAELEVRDAVAEAAAVRGVGAAAAEFGCSSRTVTGILAVWAAARSSEVEDVTAPERVALLPMRAAGGDRILVADVDEVALLDCLANHAAVENWAERAQARPEVVAMDVDPRCLAASARAFPQATVVVPRAAAVRAIEQAALRGIEAVLREGIRKARNFREPVEVFAKRDRDLSEEEKAGLRLWSDEARRLRVVKEALLDALEPGMNPQGDLLFARAEETLRRHSPDSALGLLMRTWGAAIRAGMGKIWLDDVWERLGRLAKMVSTRRTGGSFDALRILLVMMPTRSPSSRGEAGRAYLADPHRRLGTPFRVERLVLPIDEVIEHFEARMGTG